MNLESIPSVIVWLKYFSFFRYSYQALMLNIWQDWGTIGAAGARRLAYRDGDEVIAYLAVGDSSLATTIWVLVGLTMGFRLMAWMVLWRRADTYVTANM